MKGASEVHEARGSILKKLVAEDRKALDGKGPRTEKGQPHCFRGVKGGLTANSRGCW